ncbi:MAG: bifunctional riboflavin kinase/FAD synthetase [Gemmatimonadota bacterium]
MPLELGCGLPPGITRTVCTVGTFDGVHRGHQLVLERVRRAADARHLPAVLVTFEPHPLQVVNPAAAPPRLTVAAERLEALAGPRLDYVVVLPFTRALASYAAAAFVDEVLCRRLGLVHLLVGHDHGFGRGREGDAGVLRALGVDRGFTVESVPPVDGADGQPISSTAIRRAVTDGDLGRAAEALGHPYGVAGRVVAGAGRGRTLGYRTLNVALPAPHKLLPKEGVYAVRVQTPAGPFAGMLNLGPRPTFGDETPTIEAHLFDAALDLYGASVRVDFVARLRDTRAFPSAEVLVQQLTEDERTARALLG